MSAPVSHIVTPTIGTRMLEYKPTAATRMYQCPQHDCRPLRKLIKIMMVQADVNNVLPIASVLGQGCSGSLSVLSKPKPVKYQTVNVGPSTHRRTNATTPTD